MRLPDATDSREVWADYAATITERWHGPDRHRSGGNARILSLRYLLYGGGYRRGWCRDPLVRWELECHSVALAMANSGSSHAEQRWRYLEGAIPKRINRLVGTLHGIFLESDPRGPCLKLEPCCAGDLDRDPAGNGILVPLYGAQAKLVYGEDWDDDD